jgi:hypothetical protein
MMKVSDVLLFTDGHANVSIQQGNADNRNGLIERGAGWL